MTYLFNQIDMYCTQTIVISLEIRVGMVVNHFCCLDIVLSCIFLHLQAFKMPHDIVETRDGTVFVGDAGSKSVFKFTSESKLSFIKTIINQTNLFNSESLFYQDIGKNIETFLLMGVLFVEA